MLTDPVAVVAVVIHGEGRFLLGKRSATKHSAPGCWSPISGRIEVGETEESAVVREAREELGVVVAPVRKLGSFVTADRTATLHWWLTRIVSGDPTLTNGEHTELRWVTISEMRELEMMLAEDLAFFQSIEL